MIKSYRGKLAHGDIVEINLHTNNGLTGYKVVKFEMMPVAPGAQANESVIKVFTTSQTTATGAIDFNDHDLLASGFLAENGDARFHVNPVVVFDHKIVNQDIFVTYFDVDGNNGECNFYIELEQIKLTEDQALVSIVKNLRNAKFIDYTP